jgi:hypothetical protein
MNSDSEVEKDDSPAENRSPLKGPRLRVVVVGSVASLLIGSGLWIYVRYFVDPSYVQPLVPEGGDVRYLPTPQDVVERMLELADVTKDDVVYDLGSGDGRIPVTAAKQYGCQSWGYEINAELVKESRRNARENGVQDLATFEREDIVTLDLREADVVVLYLLPELNARLIPQLQQLRPGSRIATHMFEIPGVQPDEVLRMDSSEDGLERILYLYTTPLQLEGTE